MFPMYSFSSTAEFTLEAARGGPELIYDVAPANSFAYVAELIASRCTAYSSRRWRPSLPCLRRSATIRTVAVPS
jgi:hypothetical protein